VRKSFFLIFFFAALLANARENDANGNLNNNESEQRVDEENGDYDINGMILSLCGFNYFSAGLGFNKGRWGRAGPHFGGINYGAIIEYKTMKEMHFRIYGNVYGGVSAGYLGLSGILCTNFDEITAGIAPEIGMGVPGGSLFYRYNFYLNNKYNCHEIVLLIYSLHKLF
jgi:hypothetical protein